MPILDPNKYRTKDVPHDWRVVWDAYQSLRKIAARAKVSTAGWELTYPTRMKRAFKGWEMRYNSPHGISSHIYLGSNGAQAAATIRKLIPAYRLKIEDQIREQKLRERQQAPLPEDPRFNPQYINQMIERYQRRVREKIRTPDPELMRFLKSRAGFLPMSMYQYLFSHPQSTRFPTPPRSQRQVEERQRIIENESRSTTHEGW